MASRCTEARGLVLSPADGRLHSFHFGSAVNHTAVDTASALQLPLLLLVLQLHRRPLNPTSLPTLAVVLVSLHASSGPKPLNYLRFTNAVQYVH